MTLSCLACQQPTTEDQPYYCTSCFIPVSPYEGEQYIGHETAYCPECQSPLDDHNRSYCRECNHQLSFYDPPLAEEMSREMQVREKNRVKLAEDVLADNRMTAQVIEMLGIEHLPREQQGVALTALAREKMNFLSVEYNMTEAHTLTDMGHAITEQTGKDWAIQITSMRLGTIYYRKGMALHAVKLLTDTYQQAPQETEIQQLRKLELLAHLGLAHRLAGNKELADEIAEQTHDQTLQMYQRMEPTVHKMIEDGSSVSEFMGLDEENTNLPRVDYIFTILVIMAEEAIARGGDGELRVQEKALNRLMELDNIIKVLGNISPDDDTTYYASHLRDYIRIFNGLLWYGEVLLQNAHTRRRYLIEQYYERVHQWSFLIPPQFWLPLRPARFFDIFLRASTWAEFNAMELIDRLFETSPPQIKPRWHYVRADALAKIGQVEDAVEELDIILKDKEPYVQHADDELRGLAQQLYNAIHLESIGLIVGLSDNGSEWISLPLSIQLEEPSSYLEPESYLQEEKRQPVLRMAFEEPPQGPTIAVFGDKLFQHYESIPAIRKVGDREYDDESWRSTGQAGTRTDIVVLRTELPDQTLTLLFEGQPQEVVKGQLQVSPLLILRGIIHKHDITHEDLSDIMIGLLGEPEMAQSVTYLFTLKQPENN